MANPSVKDLTVDAITKVATNVTAGFIHRISKTPTGYFQSYRLTGESAPTDKAEFILMYQDHPITETISASAAIDVYVYCTGQDGILRVDV